MTRLKFFVFVLAALGLWSTHLLNVSPELGRAGQAAASRAVASAPVEVALQLEARRSELQAAVLKLGTSPVMWTPAPKAPGKLEAPTPERVESVRQMLSTSLAAANRAVAVIACVNEAGGLVAEGAEAPNAVPEGVAIASLVESGTAGAVGQWNDKPFLFYSVPLLTADKSEIRTAGSVVVGLPLAMADADLVPIAKNLGLSGLGLVRDGKVIAWAGDSGRGEGALKVLKPGAVAAVDSGPVRTLGPLQLPLFVPAPIRSVGVRQALEGTGYEVLAVASSREALDALANDQVFALGAFIGLLLLALAVAVMLGGGEEDVGPAMVVPQPMPVPVSVPAPAPEMALSREETPGLGKPPQAPEASPDDFHFPASGSAAQEAAPSAPPVSTALVPAEQFPFQNHEPAVAPAAAQVPPGPASQPSQKASPVRSTPGSQFGDDDESQTVSYPIYRQPSVVPLPGAPSHDPFPVSVARRPIEPAARSEGSDATRVASVPQELINQARPRPSLPTIGKPPTASAPPAGVPEDERHFQEVFREFLTTREKCGEAPDGLTFEKFRAKLLKNREQLIAKYQCRTVRFQVYVKEGKAALKASPLKD